MSNYNNDFAGGDSDEEDFNPAPAVASDDEGDEGRKTAGKSKAVPDEDEDDEMPVRTKTNGAASRDDDDGELKMDDEDGTKDDDGDEDDDEAKGKDDDDDDDDDEDEEDEDDEEEEVTGRARKRRRRDPRNQFIDVEAEVDEEDEEDPEDEDEIAGEDMHPDDLMELPPGADRDDRKHRELDRQRDLAASMDAEKQAALLKERYGRNRAAATDSVIVPQRLLLPSVDDPSIWRLKCKPGKEREVIFNIMKRIEDRAGTREPLQVISAFERGGVMSGSLYVEARTLADITSGLEGMQNVYLGSKPLLVPIGEMPDLLRVRKSKELQVGHFVRIKRGKYSGDLAQINDVEPNGVEVELRVIPRLDYGLNEDANAAFDSGIVKRKRPGGFGATSGGPKPPQRLFSENEAKKKHSRFLSMNAGLSGHSFQYMGETYEEGYLIKSFKANHLQTEDVNPTLEEVTKFAREGAEDGTENLDLSALAATIKSSTGAAFLPGDTVEIYQGEQRGVWGKARSVTGDIVRIEVSEGPLRGTIIESPIKGLRKLFREGDHVKVIGGSKYFDEVGMVVRIHEDRVTILTDSTTTEITVFSKDLRVASDSGGQVGLSKYDLHDLVQLDASTVGVVVKVDRESVRVLDQNGALRNLLPSQISNKLERRKEAKTVDRDSSEIRIDDTVKEYAGDSKSGRVLHIHRNYLFIHSREQLENAGVFVARATNVLTVGARSKPGGAMGALSKMNPALQRPGAAAPAMAPPPRSMGRDHLIGKTVAPRKGVNKGIIGRVVDSTDDSVRIEVASKKTFIECKKDNLTIRDPKTGAVISSDVRNGGRGIPNSMATGGHTSYGGGAMGGRTPAWGQTPHSGGRTPAWAAGGGRTPAWKDGSRTQYNNSGSSRTPAWAGGGSGNATAYGGSTSYGGGTSYGGNMTSYGGGSGTSYGGTTYSYDAPTPGAYTAPTPGASGGYDQPTPGPGRYGRDYATPGGAASAPTPGGYPQTPGAYAAETPGGMQDDAPGYD
ncbi:hypothetical protein KVT40_000680 [Elsinoe batatas]|uniref:Transcription elongation factor SPT5 n=1 Tax=Elsinoe batatas TaxID=2601811 RepID=A0A8K0LCH4_9PEZI|nr:hypothetical protein KVT40_000680 [Elsinoe batatas]